MKECDHHIIANSTFSWWASWLGKSANYKREHTKSFTIAPKKWYSNPAQNHSSTLDFFPKDWILL